MGSLHLTCEFVIILFFSKFVVASFLAIPLALIFLTNLCIGNHLVALYENLTLCKFLMPCRFLEAARQLNAEPSKCLVIEDSP